MVGAAKPHGQPIVVGWVVPSPGAAAAESCGRAVFTPTEGPLREGRPFYFWALVATNSLNRSRANPSSGPIWATAGKVWALAVLLP